MTCLRSSRRRAGVTLAELLVAIAVIVTLAGLTLVMFNRLQHHIHLAGLRRPSRMLPQVDH